MSSRRSPFQSPTTGMSNGLPMNSGPSPESGPLGLAVTVDEPGFEMSASRTFGEVPFRSRNQAPLDGKYTPAFRAPSPSQSPATAMERKRSKLTVPSLFTPSAFRSMFQLPRNG